MKVIRVIIGGVLLAWVGIASGQSAVSRGQPSTTTPTPSSRVANPKSTLEIALEEAMKNNPDLRVATAKVVEAEAELSRVKLQVAHKVAMAYAAIEEAKLMVKLMTTQLERYRQLNQRAAISQQDLRKAEMDLAMAQAKLSTTEAELAYIKGTSSVKVKTQTVLGQPLSLLPQLNPLSRQDPTVSSPAYLEMARRYRLRSLSKTNSSTTTIRNMLKKKITLTLKDATAKQILEQIRKETEGIHIQASNTDSPQWNVKVNAKLENTTVAAALQFLQDVLEGDYAFLIREYGLLITSNMPPPGATTLSDFLRLADTAEALNSGSSFNPLATLSRGKVMKVDKDLVTLSIGSDSGLKKGDSLTAYRLATPPKYLGRITVVEVMAKTTLGKFTTSTKETIQVGDEVQVEPKP